MGVPPFPDPPKWANCPCKTGFFGVSYSKVQEKWSKKGVFGPKKTAQYRFLGGGLILGSQLGLNRFGVEKREKPGFFDGFGVLIGFYHGLIKVNKSEKTSVFDGFRVLIGTIMGAKSGPWKNPEKHEKTGPDVEKTRKNGSRCRKTGFSEFPMSDFWVPLCDFAFSGFHELGFLR